MITLTDQEQTLSWREACELLVENEKSTVKFEIVTQMDEENWTGTQKNFFLEAQMRSPNMVGGTTLDERFAGNVAFLSFQYSKVEKGGTVPVLALDVDQDECSAVVDGVIGTSGLGPCVAVGLTGTSQGHRHSAVFHWSGLHSVDDVVDTLLEEVPDDLQNRQFFLAGGSRSSALYQLRMIEHLKRQSLPIGGVNLKNKEKDVSKNKVFWIDTTGKAFYAFTQ
jgi:hypothetical protein